MKIAKRVLLIVVLFVLLVAGASSIVITRENEYSLVRQFGKIDHRGQPIRDRQSAPDIQARVTELFQPAAGSRDFRVGIYISLRGNVP